MSSLTPQMEAALDGERAIMALLIKAELPAHTMRLLVGGVGAIGWDGGVFSDVDTSFGTVVAVDPIEDGAGDEAPDWSFSMFPPDESEAAQLTSPTYQEAPVRIWLAVIDPTTGAVIPDPDQLAYYLWDVGTLVPDRGKREVDIQCVSMFDRLLEDDDAAVLSDAWHEEVYPGETGFANITGIEQTIHWGVATPNPGSVTTPTTLGSYPGDA